MAIDNFGAISLGTYPTPTPSDAKRAIQAVSFGLLDSAPGAPEPPASRRKSYLSYFPVLRKNILTGEDK